MEKYIDYILSYFVIILENIGSDKSFRGENLTDKKKYLDVGRLPENFEVVYLSYYWSIFDSKYFFRFGTCLRPLSIYTQTFQEIFTAVWCRPPLNLPFSRKHQDGGIQQSFE